MSRTLESKSVLPLKRLIERAFKDCSGLTKITIPESVTKIGKQAFYDCSSLTSVTMPKKLAGVMKLRLKKIFGKHHKPIKFTFTE